MNRRALFALVLKTYLIYLLGSTLAYISGSFGIRIPRDDFWMTFTAFVWIPAVIIINIFAFFNADDISGYLYKKTGKVAGKSKKSKEVFNLIIRTFGALCWVFAIPKIAEFLLNTADFKTHLMSLGFYLVYIVIGFYLLIGGKYLMKMAYKNE